MKKLPLDAFDTGILHKKRAQVYNHNHCIQQDKVNYAVSEREDRVTDLTTLTRMSGCTGMFWAATGLQLGVIDCTGLY